MLKEKNKERVACSTGERIAANRKVIRVDQKELACRLGVALYYEPLGDRIHTDTAELPTPDGATSKRLTLLQELLRIQREASASDVETGMNDLRIADRQFSEDRSRSRH